MFSIIRKIARFLREINQLSNNICPLHGQDMQKDDVPVRYGLYRFPDEFLLAKKNRFPNSNSYRLGGCVHSEFSPRTGFTWFCQPCRVAEKEWEEENGK